MEYFLFITTKFPSVANILYYNVKVYDFYGPLSFLFTPVYKPVYLWL